MFRPARPWSILADVSHAPDVPLDSFERVGGTAAGAYHRLAPQIVLAVPRPGYLQSEEDARRSLAELDRIAAADGRKLAVIVHVNRVASQDAGARRVWSRERSHETRVATALVCSTLLSRAIGSFFLGLNRSAVPTRMFATLAEAQEWASRRVAEDGGPLT